MALVNSHSKFLNARSSFSLLSLISLSACQFGKSSALNGAVIKGPLENALVFLDYNDNGSVDAGEPSVRTSFDGTFSISGQSGFGFTVLTDSTTVDSSSGEVLANVVLKAPSGSAIVSPTTTVMEEAGLTAAEVGAVLGLPEGIDPTQFNPFSKSVDAATALAVEKVAHQVMTTVTAIQSAIEGTGADTADAFSVAMESVANVVMEKGEEFKNNSNAPIDVLDFTDATEMSDLTAIVANKVSEQGIGNVTAFNAIVDDLEVAVINVNAAIDDATDISSEESQALFALSSDLKEQVKTAAEDPDNAESSLTFTSTDAIKTAKDEKVVEIKAMNEAQAVAETQAETNKEGLDSVTDPYSEAEDSEQVELSIPTITTSYSNPLLSTSTPTIEGTATAGNTIQVFDDGEFITSVKVNDDGNWSITPDEDEPLEDGTYLVTVKQIDANGNGSAISVSIEFEIDTTAPEVPVISNSSLTALPGLATLAGTAEANGIIEVFSGETPLGTTTAEDNGNWSFTVSEVLTSGDHIFSATATDLAGNKSLASNAVTIAVDADSPDAPIISNTADSNVNALPTIQGLAEAATVVEVFAGETSLGTVTTTIDGSWSLVVSNSLTTGSTVFSATATDAVGNISAASVGVTLNVDGEAPSVPIISTAAGPIANPFPTISGTAEALSSIEILKDGISVGTTNTDQNGDWSFLDESILGIGVHSFTATATDSAGNISVETQETELTLDYAGTENWHYNSGYFWSTYNLGTTIDVEFNYFTVNEYQNGAYVGELVKTSNPNESATIELKTGTGNDLFRLDGNSVFLKDNLHYAAHYDHDYDPDTDAVSGIVGYSNFIYRDAQGDEWNYTSDDQAPENLEFFTANAIYDRDAKSRNETAGFDINLELIVTNTGTPAENNDDWYSDTVDLMIQFPQVTPVNNADIAITPSPFSGYEWGATIAKITSNNLVSENYALNYLGFPIEVVGDEIKIKDDWYIDPYSKIAYSNADAIWEFTDEAFEVFSFDDNSVVNFSKSGFEVIDLLANVQLAQIPVYAGPPVTEKIVPIDVIGHVRVYDGDDVVAIDAAAATEVAAIITAAGLSGPTSQGHIYKTSGDVHYLLAFEGSPGSEIFSLIPVTRNDSNSPWGHNSGTVIDNLNLAEVNTELGTAPVEHDVLGTILQSDGTSSHYASDQFYHGQGLGDGDDIIITFSFVEEDATNFAFGYDYPDPTSSDKIWGFTDAQKNDVREALSAFSDVANIYFHEISEIADTVGTFRFGMTDHALYGNTNAAGWASGPGGASGGDVWIANYDTTDPDAYAAAHDMSAGTIGGLTLLHEIAHGLGLKHTFEHPVADRSLESNTYTLMSYTAPEEAWYDSGSWAISHTPMILDVAALQFLYGAQTHNETDTTYSWDETVPFAATIWDTAGIDTLDFSNFTLGHDISLVDGTSSTISFPVYDYNTQKGWDVRQLPDNLSISSGAEIENAIGGAGNDTIVGNDLSNVINGGLGDDNLTGGGEDDIFEFFADFGDDIIADFIVDSDLLRFFDLSDTVITADAITAEDVGDDLVLAIGDNSLTLLDRAGETFGDNFLDIA